MKSVRPDQNTARRCSRCSPPCLRRASRARPPAVLTPRPDAGRPGRTPAGAREGPAPGRGAARRGRGGPSSLAKEQAHPLLSRVQTQPGGNAPAALHPRGPVRRLPQAPGAGGGGRGARGRGRGQKRRPVA